MFHKNEAHRKKKGRNHGKLSYKGTCSKEINFEVDGDTIRSVQFVGGCAGNTMGISKLIEGMNIDEAIKRLSGIRCGLRPTSCPDQLARALLRYKESR